MKSCLNVSWDISSSRANFALLKLKTQQNHMLRLSDKTFSA